MEPPVLDTIIERIVEVADPERIILFGSAARDEMGPHSDFDLLVVKSDVHRRKLAQRIYRNLIGVGQPVDIVVVTPEDLERYADSHALVISPALEEGTEIYSAQCTFKGPVVDCRGLVVLREPSGDRRISSNPAFPPHSERSFDSASLRSR
jgi:predicted nucleotidyltransferase